MNKTGDDEEEPAFDVDPEESKPPSEFCLLLWTSKGGRIGPKGGPIFSSKPISDGYCDNPTDCYGCPLMQEEIAKHEPGMVTWVCPGCLNDLIEKANSKGIAISFPGHFTEGQCQYSNCQRPARQENVPRPQEVVPGYSRLLQLVIGKINE